MKTTLKLCSLCLMVLVASNAPAYAVAQQPDATTFDADSAAVTDSLLRAFDNIELQGITVTAQRQLIKQEIDRVSYDVQADVTSRTSTVLEMLRKVPLVTVDAQDNIRVNGSTTFKIYRNGHPDPSLSNNPKEVLKSLPANSIKRIEVITNPGAKYDAEGTDVILNIVTRDGTSFKGVSGAVDYQQTFPNDNQSISLNLTTQLDKVVTSGYGFFGHTGDEAFHDKTTTNSVNQLTGDRDLSVDENKGNINFAYSNLSASWEPDTLNLVSMSGSYMLYHLGASNITDFNRWDANDNPLFEYTTNYRSKTNYYNLDGRIDYEHRTHRKNEAITLSYMIDSWRQRTTSFTRYQDAPTDYTGIDGNTWQQFAEHTFQLDWTRPFAQYHKFETGLKYIYRLNRSHDQRDYLDTELTSDDRFDHTTQVGAAYASYAYNRGPWSARAGLRYEHSRLSGKYPDGSQEDFSSDLNDWVPNASVKYNLNDANSLTLAYKTSIHRPGIQYLNPAVTLSPTSRSYGNPDLSSSLMHTISLTWMHIDSKFTLNLSSGFRRGNNGITNVQWAEGDIIVSTFGNEWQCSQVWLSAYAQWQPFDGTDISFNGDMSYADNRSDNLGIKISRLSANFYASLTQKLPWKLRLTANGGIFGGGAGSLYGYQGYVGTYSIGLQRSFLKDDRLTIRVAATDFIGKYDYIHSYVTRGDILSTSSMRSPRHQLSVGVSYRFGSLKAQVKSTDRTIENNDLQGSGKKK